MAAFLDDTKIANRALMRVGSARIAAGALLTEDSVAADNVRACYTVLRRAELRRNVWRFAIRKTALRALNGATKNVTFAAWAIGTAYAQNDVVAGSDGLIYAALVGANTGNDPTSTNGFWTLYFGPLQAAQFTTTWNSATTYARNQYAVGSNGTTYISLVNANIDIDPTLDSGTNWVVSSDVNGGISYFSGELVYTLGTTQFIFVSLVSQNQTNPLTDTTGSWLEFTTQPDLSAVNFLYPVGTGPSENQTTANVFMLPNGFLREAPQDPKGNRNSFLGGPSGRVPDDWNFENQCFTSWQPGPIVFRFAADVSDPTLFDPLFVEGYACRVALEVCEPLTQSREKLNDIGSEYKKFMGEARTVNGIETGETDPEMDEYLVVRI